MRSPARISTPRPKTPTPFYSQTLELEYGVTAWYTAELYLQGQSTQHDSTIFTGFRLENRLRPLRSEHWVNPVIYVEYEDHSQADKSFMEITDHQVITDQQISNALLRNSVESAPSKASSSSQATSTASTSPKTSSRKKISPMSRGSLATPSEPAAPLASAASPHSCRLCRQYFAVGGELFGGLGTRYDFGLKGTSQYAGPTLSYSTPRAFTFTFGPEFGLNANSAQVLWRLKAAYEFSQFRDLFRRNR